MPSVRDNTKYRCKTPGCGMIYDFPTLGDVKNCVGCGHMDYDQIRITAVCDFCAAVDPTWTYPCHDFIVDFTIIGLPGDRKVGAWGACDTCHDLIEADDWDGLREHCIATEPDHARVAAIPQGRFLLDKMFDILWRQFRENRCGEPYRHTKEEWDAD